LATERPSQCSGGPFSSILQGCAASGFCIAGQPWGVQDADLQASNGLFPIAGHKPPEGTVAACRRFFSKQEDLMPRGDKSSYTGKQKRMAEHIEEGYEHRGVPEREAERRAWATVNKETHGGKKSGSGRGKKEDHSPARKGGRLGGKAAAKRPAAARSRSAKKAARTRKRRAA